MKKIFLPGMVLAAVLLLGGCMDSGIDGLYSLPRMQEEYQQLQSLIDQERDAGFEYSAPTAGVQRQSIQLVDVDADGTEEVFAYLKNTLSVPAIYIYKLSGGEYELVSTITGEGTAIGRVEYEDLDGDGLSEIIVTWKMNDGLSTVSAYSLEDWNPSVVFSVSGTDFRVEDFGTYKGLGGGMEVAVLDMSEGRGGVELYFVGKDGGVESVSAELSDSMTVADRFRIYEIAGQVQAMFVEGNYKQEDITYYLTDIFVFTGTELKNITLDPKTGDSIAQRMMQVYSQDINGDGTLDVPFLEPVFKQTKMTGEYYVFDWATFSADGSWDICAFTYHHSSPDGWYYVIPEEWREGFTVRRETEQTDTRAVVLSTVNKKTGEVTDRLTIYILTDENRNDRARLPGRFVLMQSDTTVYAARLENADGALVSEEQKNDVIQRFHIITPEWTTGAV